METDQNATDGLTDLEVAELKKQEKEAFYFYKGYYGLLQEVLELGHLLQAPKTLGHVSFEEYQEMQNKQHSDIAELNLKGFPSWANNTISNLRSFKTEARLSMKIANPPWINEKAWRQALDSAHYGLMNEDSVCVYAYPPNEENRLKLLWITYGRNEHEEHRYDGEVLAYGFKGPEDGYNEISGSLHFYDLLAIQVGLAPKLNETWDLKNATCITRDYFSDPLES